MTLNKQLLCVSLLLLSLPWAGCQFVREMDRNLKEHQQQTLVATAAVVARALTAGEAADQDFATAIFYCHPLRTALLIDGYFDEWTDERSTIPWQLLPVSAAAPHLDTDSGTDTDTDTAGNRRFGLRFRCGITADQLALAFSVDDSEVIYNNPTISPIEHGDRLLLATPTAQYVFAAVAPGAIPVRDISEDPPRRESRISAAWIDRDNGYQLEVRIPMQLVQQRLSFAVIDADRDHNQRYGPYREGTEVPQLVYPSDDLDKRLQAFHQPGTRLRLLSPQGWLLASVGSPEPTQRNGAHWLLQKLFQLILQDGHRATTPAAELRDGYDASPRSEFQQALGGEAASRWYRHPQRPDYQLLSAALPIGKGDTPAAVLLAEQSSAQTAALTDRAFYRLSGITLLALALTMLGLLSYASWLSLRIRRLSRATRRALDERGNIRRQFPHSRAGDEIGMLTRNYAELMQRIAAYTEYLQTLSRKLSHELRTPLAIVNSSLDNLAALPLDDASRTYLQRASSGAQRLGSILTAMSEARRVEESLATAEPEAVELTTLLRDLIQAYRDIYPQHRILANGLDDGEQWLTATPDLLVQMLDKLMANAASFCPPGQTIALQLTTAPDSLSITVSNDGPLLPAAMQSQLFDNMVSVRDGRDSGDDMHLGLGLYIVRLIVDFHHGQVSAHNRRDQQGVVFTVVLPRQAQHRDTNTGATAPTP